MRILLLFLYLIFISTITSQICSPPTAIKQLNIGNVKTTILNSGDMWWDGIDQGSYFAPNDVLNNYSIIWGGGLWMSAKDNQNNLKVAAITYSRYQGYEFYPGPIDNQTGSLDYTTCQFYDQIFEVKRQEIKEHIYLLQNYSSIPIHLIHQNILNWPAKGNTHLGISIEQDLAPFFDFNNNGIYDPENGDFPKVKGDQTFFWVMNDIGGFHQITGGETMGIEIQMMAHAFNRNNILNDVTIYDCKIINKSFQHLNNFNFGIYMDPSTDIYDEFAGCNQEQNRGFVYTDNFNPFNFNFLNLTFLNQDLDVYNAISVFDTSITQNYDEVIDNLLNGLNRDGSPLCDSINCPLGSTLEFPDDSAYLMETNHPYWQTDYRMLTANHQDSLLAWESYNISWAISVHQTQYLSYDDFNPLVTQDINNIKILHRVLNDSLNKLNSIVTSVSEVNDNKIQLSPNPTNGMITLHSSLNISAIHILSMDGKLIQRIDNINSNSSTLNLSSLEAGIYFLNIKNGNQQTIKKVIKN